MPGDESTAVTTSTTKRPFVEAFSEAISDGVWAQECHKIVQIPTTTHAYVDHLVHVNVTNCFSAPVAFHVTPCTLTGAEVPAKQCVRLQHAACHDGAHTSDKFNVARNAYRFIRRAGVAWKVPLDVFQYVCDDGSLLDIHYLHPKKLLTYLLEEQPMTIFGTNDPVKAAESLNAFWTGFRQYHPLHHAFSLGVPLDRLIPICIHGDEGRGKRRSQTTVFSIESLLGLKGYGSSCDECCPQQSWDAPYGEVDGLHHPFQNLLRHNMKSHSFLQHFPLFVLPGTLWKNYKRLTKEMISFLASELKALFDSGLDVSGVNYRVVVVGSKGDLKWVGKIGCLTRGYEHQGRVQALHSCHQCLAGTEDCPAEDISTFPIWMDTLHLQRPWSITDLPCLHEIPFDDEKLEWIYKGDVFHNLKLGIYRDFSASCLFLFMKWKYFGRDAMPVLLEKAHGHFSLWAKTLGKTVALRSFTLALFNYKNSSSYVWSNTKGSDTSLLCQWIATLSVGLMAEEPDNQKKQVLSVIAGVASLSSKWFDILYTHGMFLSRTCAGCLYETGQGFLQGYAWLASFCMEHKLCLFGLKPKCHFQKHTLLEIYLQLEAGSTSILSPVVWDCSQNEDLIGKVCRIARKIDTRVLPERILQFYLIKAAVLLRRHEKVHKDLDQPLKKK